MITNQRKQSLCEAHKSLLELIWALGKGLMYKKHIEAYMEHFYGVKPQHTWAKLKELEENDVVQRIKLYNIVVIKLKKYAIRFLLGVERESIRSIEVTATKLNRTAYVNAMLLHHINTIPSLKRDYQSFLNKYYLSSMFSKSRYKSYEVLETLKEKSVLVASETNESDVDIEIAKLKGIQMGLFPTKEADDEESKEENAEESKKEYEFNINSMEQHSIFIDFMSKKEGLHIAILDDKNNLTGKKLAEKVMKTYDYLNTFFPLQTVFNFTVYVRNEKRLEEVQSKANKKGFDEFVLKNHKKLAYRSEYCERTYVNLDLDKNLFGNQSLILTGSMKSKAKVQEVSDELVAPSKIV